MWSEMTFDVISEIIVSTFNIAVVQHRADRANFLLMDFFQVLCHWLEIPTGARDVFLAD